MRFSSAVLLLLISAVFATSSDEVVTPGFFSSWSVDQDLDALVEDAGSLQVAFQILFEVASGTNLNFGFKSIAPKNAGLSSLKVTGRRSLANSELELSYSQPGDSDYHMVRFDFPETLIGPMTYVVKISYVLDHILCTREGAPVK